jgi:hypothetical protein
MQSIFVQIASYRDPELVPTLLDLLEKAKRPERISIGVVNQYAGDDFDDNLKKVKNKIRLLEIYYKESKGTCWARNLTQRLYLGEDYSLQLDSHHRFEKDWDETIISMYEELGDQKAIFTMYPAPYMPNWSYDQYSKDVYICRIKGFSADGKIEAYPDIFKDWKSASKPRKAAHVAAGFLFGRGEINNVLYDPYLYFSGEEFSLAIRYFTHGYNLYHPHKLICYHYYTRNEQPKHWGDHKDWHKYNEIATNRLNCLVGRDSCDLGQYGLGKERTINDWKDYSGIDFLNKTVHKDTVEGIEPPCSNSECGWEKEKIFDHVLDWDYSKVEKCPDPKFWAFFIVDENKVAMHREDVTDPDIMSGKVNIKKFTFKYRGKPSQLLIWPYSHSKEWLGNVYLPINLPFSKEKI